MSEQDRNLHGQLYSQILEKLSGRTAVSATGANAIGGSQILPLINDDLQLLYPFHDWWWPNPPEGYFQAEAYNLLSRMPSIQSGPATAVKLYQPSNKTLYSTYRNMLLNCPKFGVDPNVSLPVKQYQEALKASEKPSSEDEMKPGFVKMATNVGAVVCENYVVGDGKDWVFALKKKADEITSQSGVAEMYSPGGSSELLGSLHNVTVDLSTESAPPNSADIPESKEPFFGVYTTDNKWENFDIYLDDKKVSVSIKFGALARVLVEPDKKWYDSAYLYTLAKQNSWNPPFTTESIFGEKGLLSQRINGLIAAYHVAFKITVSPEAYGKFEDHFKNAHGVRLGPLSFGAGTIPSTIPGVSPKQPTPTPIKPKADPFTHSFVGEHMADHPAIVGLTVAKILPEKY